MLEFRKIAVTDKELFESYTSKPDFFGSECAFSNLFVWQTCYKIYWTVAYDFLVVKVKRDGVNFFLCPFGGKDEDLPKLFEELRAYNDNKPFEIHGIYESQKARMEAALPNVQLTEDRNNWDYVYLRDSLANLSGRKYHSKKNHCNAFQKVYPDYVYEPLTEANYAECMQFADDWCERKSSEDPSLLCEKCAIHEAFGNFEALGLRGGAIRINGKVEAFSFGKKINDETAVIHVEKANPEIRGLYAVINRDFAKNAWDDVKYLNREEDMGVEGLRAAKESYKPEFMVKKYSVTVE